MSAQAQQACPECSGTVQTEGGEAVCGDCGVVVTDQEIDHGPEWRSFDDPGPNPSRVGPARTERRHDHGLGSEIGYDGAAGDTQQLARMRRQDSRAAMDGKKGRNKAELLTEVRRICGQLDAGDATIDRACRIARVGHDAEVAIGESLDSFAVAAVLASIRDQGLPLPMGEVLEHSDADRSTAYRVLRKTYDATDAEGPPVEPVEHVPRIASAVAASSETEALARDILLEAQDRELHVGKKPAGVAAGALYAAGRRTGELLTQRDIAEPAGVTAVTLRDRYHELADGGVVEEVADDE